MKITFRIFQAVLLAALLASGCFSARADYASSERWFNKKSVEDRSLLQSDLILLGYYNALADTKFGAQTYSAITSFQETIGVMPTGVLTSNQHSILTAAANRIYTDLGFDEVRDQRGNIAMLLPKGLLPLVDDTRRGTSYTAKDGSMALQTIRKAFSEESFESLYRRLSSGAGRTVSYKKFNDLRFVISGSNNGRRFYTYVNYTATESIGFSLEWVPARDEVGAMVATFIASYSYPLAFASEPEVAKNPDKIASQPEPAPSAPIGNEIQISSGTGFFVADGGVMVTNHHVVNGCSNLDIAGYGKAKVITSDEEVDLAVLKLTTPRPHPVATIRSTPVDLGEQVIALGFPLAELLDSSLNVGTGIVSSESSLTGEARWFTTNVGIQPGNSGGPILDDRGEVIGVAVAKIDDEVLLAAAGTTAPNIGFAIKGSVLADYLRIFRLPEAGGTQKTPKSVKALAEVGKAFTVLITCETAK